MPIVPFTDLAIRSLKPGLYFDHKTPAFGIRIGKHRKTWIVVKEPNRTKVSVGYYPALTLSEARKKALVVIGSPHQAPTTARSFPEAVEQFLALDRWKPSSKYQLSRNIKGYFKWTKSLDKITHNDVARVIEDINAKSQAAHCLKDIKTFFNWCIPRYIPHNPCNGLRGQKYKPRQRTLNDAELKAVWNARDEVPKPFGDIVRLLILTGARKSEIAGLKWEHVGDMLTFPETKSGRTHIIPATPTMKTIIDAQPMTDSPYVFPGRTGKAWNGWVYKAELDKATGVKGATIHDLRRTFAHNWQRMGVRLEITEAALGHLGTRGGIVGVYQTYAYTDELKTHYADWDGHLQKLMNS